MRFSAGCVVTALALPPSGLSAQEVVRIEPGQRVRVTAPELGVDRQVAEFEAMDGGLLTLTADSTLQVPLSAVTRVDLYAGRKSHPWKGAGIGFLAGYAAGFLVWQVAVGYCYPGATTLNCAAVLGGGMGAIAGTLIGAIVGAPWQTDKWDEVPLEGVQVCLMPRPDGLGIGARIEF